MADERAMPKGGNKKTKGKKTMNGDGQTTIEGGS